LIGIGRPIPGRDGVPLRSSPRVHGSKTLPNLMALCAEWGSGRNLSGHSPNPPRYLAEPDLLLIAERSVKQQS
jgi:hypothetical protein